MNSRNDRLTRQQLGALLFCAMLSPLIRQIPATVVGSAGKTAWISAALAFAPTAGVWWLLSFLLRRRLPGEGAGEMICRALGHGAGRIVVLLYALCLLFYGGFVLRAGADRFAAAVYPESPVWLFMGVMLLLLLPATLGRLKTLSRCAEVLSPVLLALFLLVFVFAVPEMEAEELLPLRFSDIHRIVSGIPPVADTLLVAVFLLFLIGRVDEGDLFRPLLTPLSVLAALGVGLCLTTVGTFGAALTERMNYPFFVMIRGIRIFHLLERVEALVIAQWVAADFLLLGALGQAASGALTLALLGPGRDRCRWFAVFSLPAMALAGWLCAPTAFALQKTARTAIPLLNAGMVVLLLLILLVGRLRKTV